MCQQTAMERIGYLTEAFKTKFGTAEIKVPEITVISEPELGSGGITKIRVRNNKVEYYLNWWAYGWYSDMKYLGGIEKALEYAVYQVEPPKPTKKLYEMTVKVNLVIYTMKDKIYLDDLDLTKIQGLDNFNCEYNWFGEDDYESDRQSHSRGFGDTQVTMEVTRENGHYLLYIVSTLPFDTKVSFHKYGSYRESDKVTMPLKSAILWDIHGHLSDGIGENPVGIIRHDYQKYEVWLENKTKILKIDK